MAKSDQEQTPEPQRERKARPRRKPAADAAAEGLTVTLLRHGKSDWSDKDLADFDRPLAKRGQKAVPRMAEVITELGLVPDIVLCSAAQRTVETLDLIRPHLSGSVGTEIDPSLYLAAPSHLLQRLHGLPPGFRHAMLIGHNPGLHALALDLVRDGERDAIRALARKLPTAGLVVMHFPVALWTQIQTGTGHLVHFLTPAAVEAARK